MREAQVYLVDILEAIQRIEEYLTGLTFGTFSKDKKTIDAVIRNFAVIGEAAKHVPLSLKQEHPEISWKRMAGMRDKVIHEYFGVDVQILWNASKIDLSVLKPQMEDLLKELTE
ncbi:MAG: DUF86 domain-containing protein [Candidatus Bathyarchaeota archaeon]|nr:DUF86 domain-containing protein [Candidatus Bathyarchaeota archaeon]